MQHAVHCIASLIHLIMLDMLCLLVFVAVDHHSWPRFGPSAVVETFYLLHLMCRTWDPVWHKAVRHFMQPSDMLIFKFRMGQWSNLTFCPTLCLRTSSQQESWWFQWCNGTPQATWNPFWRGVPATSVLARGKNVLVGCEDDRSCFVCDLWHCGILWWRDGWIRDFFCRMV